MYKDLCEENSVIQGSPEATYLWKEYTSDLVTLGLLEEIEETGIIPDEQGTGTL